MTTQHTEPDSLRSCDGGYVSSAESIEELITEDLRQLGLTGREEPKFGPGGRRVTDGSRRRQTNVFNSGELEMDAEPDEPTDAFGNVPTAESEGITAKPEQRDPGGEVVPGGSRHPVPTGAPDELPQAQAAVPADEDNTDEGVPIELRLPQIDFIILAAKADQKGAEQFMNDKLCCKVNKVTGALHDEKFVEVEGEVKVVHSQKMGTVLHNYERATYVLPYITEALFEQKEARTFLYGALHDLCTNEERENSVIPLWFCSKDDLFAKACPKKMPLARVVNHLNGVQCDNQREIEKLKLLLKGSHREKARRSETQLRLREKWKKEKEKQRREDEKQGQQTEEKALSYVYYSGIEFELPLLQMRKQTETIWMDKNDPLTKSLDNINVSAPILYLQQTKGETVLKSKKDQTNLMHHHYNRSNNEKN